MLFIALKIKVQSIGINIDAFKNKIKVLYLRKNTIIDKKKVIGKHFSVVFRTEINNRKDKRLIFDFYFCEKQDCDVKRF